MGINISSFRAIRELQDGLLDGWFCVLSVPVCSVVQYSVQFPLFGNSPISQGVFLFRENLISQDVFLSGKLRFSRAVSCQGNSDFPGRFPVRETPIFQGGFLSGKLRFSRALFQSYFPERFSRLSRDIASCFWIFTGESTVTLQIR
jgi:hypothetical protein